MKIIYRHERLYKQLLAEQKRSGNKTYWYDSHKSLSFTKEGELNKDDLIWLSSSYEYASAESPKEYIYPIKINEKKIFNFKSKTDRRNFRKASVFVPFKGPGGTRLFKFNEIPEILHFYNSDKDTQNNLMDEWGKIDWPRIFIEDKYEKEKVLLKIIRRAGDYIGVFNFESNFESIGLFPEIAYPFIKLLFS